MLPKNSEKRSATGAASAPPRPAMRPAQKRIAPATPSKIAGGTGSGSVRAHQKPSPIALAQMAPKTRAQLIDGRAPGSEAIRRSEERRVGEGGRCWGGPSD